MQIAVLVDNEFCRPTFVIIIDSLALNGGQKGADDPEADFAPLHYGLRTSPIAATGCTAVSSEYTVIMAHELSL